MSWLNGCILHPDKNPCFVIFLPHSHKHCKENQSLHHDLKHLETSKCCHKSSFLSNQLLLLGKTFSNYDCLWPLLTLHCDSVQKSNSHQPFLCNCLKLFAQEKHWFAHNLMISLVSGFFEHPMLFKLINGIFSHNQKPQPSNKNLVISWNSFSFRHTKGLVFCPSFLWILLKSVLQFLAGHLKTWILAGKSKFQFVAFQRCKRLWLHWWHWNSWCRRGSGSLSGKVCS